MRIVPAVVLAGLLVAIFLSPPGLAQQVTVASPYRNMSDRFFEQNGISWGGNWRGMNFSFGDATLAKPAFGGFNASAGLSTNYAITGKNFQANFALNFTQGYQQTFSTQTPSVTLMNGQTGFFSDTSQTPFVISEVPVVGAFPIVPNFSPIPASFFSLADPAIQRNSRVREMLRARINQEAQDRQAEGDAVIQGPQPRPTAPPVNARAGARMHAPDPVAEPAPGPGTRLAAAQASSAGRAAPSVEEAQRLHEQEQAAANGDVRALIERARALEEDGKPNVARIYYQMVVKRADGELKQHALHRLDALNGTANP
jgi:hypothetical protein